MRNSRSEVTQMKIKLEEKEAEMKQLEQTIEMLKNVKNMQYEDMKKVIDFHEDA